MKVVEPVPGPLDAVVRVPGSKSLTNRGLVCAALAEGESELGGVLFADDTEAMLDSLARLGFELAVDRSSETVQVRGGGGRVPVDTAELDARLSGTTARFLAPVLALGAGPYRLDGGPSMQTRPMAPGFEALRSLGVAVTEEGEPGHLPATIGGGLAGGSVRLTGDVSSQFLSGLLMAAPCTRLGLRVELTTDLVSRPYVELTTSTMEAFGATVDERSSAFEVAPGGYRATRFEIEPDASAASYFFAAAVICGGQVRVEGLRRHARQGDARFPDVLARMGAAVARDDTGTTVASTGRLHGIEVDLRDLSDCAQTLAAVAPFADSPTRVSGIGFIRTKETDRVGNTVKELRRCGIDAEAEPDGFVIHPGTPHAAVVETYDDHRMAMSFALLGLRVPGIAIADPGCVAKTFPGYWDTLAGLRADNLHS